MNPGTRFTTTSSTVSPLSQEIRYTLWALMVGVAEPFGMTQLAPVTLWFTPGPVMVQEESTPVALQVTVVPGVGFGFETVQERPPVCAAADTKTCVHGPQLLA